MSNPIKSVGKVVKSVVGGVVNFVSKNWKIIAAAAAIYFTAGLASSYFAAAGAGTAATSGAAQTALIAGKTGGVMSAGATAAANATLAPAAAAGAGLGATATALPEVAPIAAGEALAPQVAGAAGPTATGMGTGAAAGTAGVVPPVNYATTAAPNPLITNHATSTVTAMHNGAVPSEALAIGKEVTATGKAVTATSKIAPATTSSGVGMAPSKMSTLGKLKSAASGALGWAEKHPYTTMFAGSMLSNMFEKKEPQDKGMWKGAWFGMDEKGRTWEPGDPPEGAVHTPVPPVHVPTPVDQNVAAQGPGGTVDPRKTNQYTEGKEQAEIAQIQSRRTEIWQA